MSEIADDYPNPAEELAAEDAADAYAALPWWRRALVDHRARRSEARYWRRYRRQQRARIREYRRRGETPPPPGPAPF